MQQRSQTQPGGENSVVGVFISMRNVEFRTSSAVAVQTRGASERKPSAPSTGSLHVPF